MDKLVLAVWNGVEKSMTTGLMETHKTRAIFVGALYAAAQAIAINGAHSREISEAAHWIENQPDKVYKNNGRG